jgi:copper(I)-binding protein
MNRVVPYLFAIATHLATPAQACELTLDEAWIRSAPPGATALAGYGVLRNTGAESLQVSTVSSPAFGRVEIHETSIVDGVARMRRIDQLEIPAHGEVRLEPSGKHIMLLDPKKDLAVGETAEVVFTNCKPNLSVELTVKESALQAEHSHDHHHHH